MSRDDMCDLCHSFRVNSIDFFATHISYVIGAQITPYMHVMHSPFGRCMGVRISVCMCKMKITYSCFYWHCIVLDDVEKLPCTQIPFNNAIARMVRWCYFSQWWWKNSQCFFFLPSKLGYGILKYQFNIYFVCFIWIQYRIFRHEGKKNRQNS